MQCHKTNIVQVQSQGNTSNSMTDELNFSTQDNLNEKELISDECNFNNNNPIVNLPHIPGIDTNINAIETVVSTKFNEVENFDLLHVLSNHATGKSILKQFSNLGYLEHTAQIELSDIIAKYFLNFSHIKICDAEVKYILVAKVLPLFTSEVIETYFVSPVKKKNSPTGAYIPSKGKLRDKFRNVRKFINDTAGVEKGAVDIADIDMINFAPQLNKDQTATSSKQWLSENWENSVDKIDDHWNKSYSLRLNLNEKPKSSFSTRLKDWPFLVKDSGIDLVRQFGFFFNR